MSTPHSPHAHSGQPEEGDAIKHKSMAPMPPITPDEVATFNAAVDLVAGAVTKFVAAGLGGAEAGKLALCLFQETIGD